MASTGLEMKNKTVVVTGASRGIGAAIASAFSESGAHVIGTCTKQANLESCCADWLISDFSDVGQIQSCAKEIANIGPDILINNAGINKISRFQDVTAEDFLLIQQVNVFAPFVLCQAAIPAMQLKSWGRIVNISSIWGKIGKEYRASYAASKFALDGITLSIAAEHSQDGIIANCVAPGFTDTELTRRILGDEGIAELVAKVPMQRMASIKEIASFVAWLGSDKNTYISGQNIAIDGGFSRV